MTETVVNLMPAPYVTVHLAATLTGLTEKSIRRRIEEGRWLDGREYRRAPDGGIFVSMKGYSSWVEKTTALQFASGQSD